jgi:hypothetical protein
MKKNINKKIIFLFALTSVIFCLFIFSGKIQVKAETKTDTTYTLLAPIPGIGDANNVIDTAEHCTIDKNGDKVCTNSCPFGSYLSTLIKIFLGICAVLAMIMIVWGGIEYMTSDLASSKESGKKTITQAILGLLLALGAYLILYTINPDLLDVCLNKLPKAEIKVLDDNIPQTAILKNGKYYYCVNTDGANGGYEKDADWKAIAGSPKTLPITITGSQNKATVNKKECTKVGEPDCTSTRNLNLSTINTILSKCKNCGEIKITGGTECWLHGGTSHKTTHHPNSSTIDLRIKTNLALDAYIKSGTRVIGENNSLWYKTDGLDYLQESDHWHVGH